ncbi:hypothetical protein CCO02nite_08860 [Cellulomonas composti]|uniref:Uncharacterized protein n=2 Tax=Cellulomonas composti TaxID=266130 RepID=A0A511J8C0_9CELL|nr:hypothetical protein CCO02nite_08860 [Cellulomonas composti]
MLAVRPHGEQEALTLTTSNGVTHLRWHTGMNDAVMHSGTIVVGDDDCLYVTLSDTGESYLAAVGPDDRVARDGVTHGGVLVAVGEVSTFGRVTPPGEAPAVALERCTGATEWYGIGW